MPDIPAFIVHLKRLRLGGRFGKFVLRGQLRHPRARIGTSMRELTIDGVLSPMTQIATSSPRSATTTRATSRSARSCFEAAKDVRRPRGQAAEARQPRAVHTRDVRQPYNNENTFGTTYGEHREALEFGRDRISGAAAATPRSSASRSSPPRSIFRAPTSSRSSTCRPTRSPRATSPTRRCSSTWRRSASR